MKYFCLPNLHYNDVEVRESIWKLDPAPVFGNKDRFREWCNDKETRHCFYSAVEALTPSLRVSVANPAHLMHGLICDYDSKISNEDIAVIPSNGNPARLPTWVSTTHSGGKRLVFEFEEPILVDNAELFDRFIRLLAKDLKLQKLLAGLDETSFKRAQYYELGDEWKPIPQGKTISAEHLSLLLFEAAGQRQLKTEGTQIPIEAVAAEVERQFPGRWPGSFEGGARGPLFWIADGVDRIGCQVGDLGMICYSERAGKSFLHWGEILGQEFVKNYEAERIGSAAQGIWFDGRHYWREALDGGWRHRTKDDMIMWLKGQGVSASAGPKGTASEAEKVLLMAQELRSIKAAAPIVHDNREAVMINGDRYLNISAVKIMEPADRGEPSDFPWLHEFFTKCWDEKHPEQRDYFLAWLQHFYVPCLQGRPQQGQAVIIAGDASRGKTFFNHKILGEIMGGFADSTDFLMGKTNFNKSDSEVSLWAIDDSRGASSWENHAAFSSALKKHVANPQVRCEGKGRDAFTIPWRGRIVLTCNKDKESLNIIPALNATIKDKVDLFMWGKWQAKFLSAGQSEAVVQGELPFFLHWLQNWKAPAYVLNDNPRYHVQAYHHPDMLREAHDSSPSARLAELLEEWRGNMEGDSMWVSATRLRRLLSEDPSARDGLKEFSRNRMAQGLEDIGTEYVLETRRHAGNQEYLIKLR